MAMNKFHIGFRVLSLLLGLFLSVAVAAEFQKSPNDHREYRAFQLDNQLQVLVISDPETSQAAVSLAVRIGAGDDPPDRAGLAHYLEHMMFLGTEKYPELDSYRRYIDQNGGSSNAFTAIDLTNYNFRIDANKLQPALDQFAQFFIAPLLPEQQIDRERAVVHAEYEMRTQRDSVRRWSAMRQTYNQNHPASRFASGTKDTLAGDIRDELIQFFEEKYSANLMNLVVLGREPLDQLQMWVKDMFSDIRNNQYAEREITEPLFSPGSLPALLKFKTLKHDPTLALMFPLQDLEPYWRERPGSYIAHLLGHEGQGSLLSELKAQGWALGLFASTSDTGITTSAFNVHISLTEEGYQNWDQVTGYVFQYIREVRKRGIEEWRFKENQILAEIEYRFAELDDPASAVTGLASHLHKYPQDELFPALFLVENYDPVLIADVLDRMAPENALVVLAGATVETDQITPYLRSEFSITKIEPELVANWNSDVADASNWLPQRNEFLPENLDLVARNETAVPERIYSSPGFELWHQTDTSFDVPRASFFVTVRSPVTKSSAKNSILLSLYIDALNDQLNEFVYPALIAGLDFSLYPHSRGFSFRISGFNDNQSALLERILETLKSAEFDPDRFEIHRQEIIRDIKNSRRDTAYRRTISDFYSTILVPNWSEEEQLRALDEIDFEDLLAFGNEVLERINVVALSHGNVEYETSKSMGQMVATLVDPEKVVEVYKSDVVVLPGEGPYRRLIEIENADSAISLYLQGADKSLRERAYMSLLSQIIQTPFFSDLRTVQQMGYVVFSHYIPVGRVPGIMFVIQSPDVVPDDMNAAVEVFLENFPDWLADRVNDDEFEAYKSGITGQLLKKYDSLGEKSEVYWTAIDQKEFNFDSREVLAQEIERIDRQSFDQFVQNLLIGKSNHRLVVLGYGENHGLPVDQVLSVGLTITDLDSFKQGLELFPQG